MSKLDGPDGRYRTLLRYIQGYTLEHGFSPMWEEIKEACGYASKATVARDLNALRAGGVVDWLNGQSRTLRVLVKLDAGEHSGLWLEDKATGEPRRVVINSGDPSSPLEEAVNARLRSLEEKERILKEGVGLYIEELRLRAERRPDPESDILREVADELEDSLNLFIKRGESK